MTSTIVVKIGTSSLAEAGRIRPEAVAKLVGEVADLGRAGHRVVVVTSAAIAAGRAVMDLNGEGERLDTVTLQALSAVGQGRLMGVYEKCLTEEGLVGGQILLAPLDFFERTQYLHARATLERLLDLGVVPIVNENDAVADDAIRFGDNDRIAALVANLVRADMLVLLTDTAGLLTSDPRFDDSGRLIEEVIEIDQQLEQVAGGAGAFGSGGMASKLSAARIASWSGITTVIAAAHRPNVLADAVAGVSGTGTFVRGRARDRPLAAKKLWIAFAVAPRGLVTVDAGARIAVVERGTSLLAVGVIEVKGDFRDGDAVEIADPQGVVFAKGLVSADAQTVRKVAGLRSEEQPPDSPAQIVHRDDLLVIE